MPARRAATSDAPITRIPTTLAFRCHSSRTHLESVPEGVTRREANHGRRDDVALPLRVVHLCNDGAAAIPVAVGDDVISSHPRG